MGNPTKKSVTTVQSVQIYKCKALLESWWHHTVSRIYNHLCGTVCTSCGFCENLPLCSLTESQTNVLVLDGPDYAFITSVLSLKMTKRTPSDIFDKIRNSYHWVMSTEVHSKNAGKQTRSLPSGFLPGIPQDVKADTPADRSQVLPLDVVLYVNGASVVDVPLAKARKLIANSDDQMILSVMASSSYRLLTTRRDMMSLMRTVQKDSVIVASGGISCGGSRPYGMGIIDAQVWDDKAKLFYKAFVLTV